MIARRDHALLNYPMWRNNHDTLCTRDFVYMQKLPSLEVRAKNMYLQEGWRPEDRIHFAQVGGKRLILSGGFCKVFFEYLSQNHAHRHEADRLDKLKTISGVNYMVI
jgi:hypothetical protein